jgi:hypothetical protein
VTGTRRSLSYLSARRSVDGGAFPTLHNHPEPIEVSNASRDPGPTSMRMTGFAGRETRRIIG